MGPPSSGGLTICIILNVLEGYPLAYLGFNSAQTIHYMAEAMRRAYIDRNRLLGDPDFVDNPRDTLLSEAHAAELRASIPDHRATAIGELRGASGFSEGTNTTHLSATRSP